MKKLFEAFTLVEVMVTGAIISIFAVITIFNYASFSDKLSLSSAGQEIAIAIRQAQSYGINVKESGVSSGDFTKSYGIYFNPNGSSGSFYLFIDKNGDNKYNDAVGNCIVSGGTECMEKIDLKNGVTITTLGSTASCPPLNSVTAVHITFRRPNPDAEITFSNGSGVPCVSQSNAQITIRSPRGSQIVVNVENTGQIYLQ